MGRCALGLVALVLPLGALAQPSSSPIELTLEAPASLTVGDRTEVRAFVAGAAEHPLLLTPRVEGTAVAVVRGRLLRADARDPEADRLELRIPIVAERTGTSVLRVEVQGYACDGEDCRAVRTEGSLVLTVGPR